MRRVNSGDAEDVVKLVCGVRGGKTLINSLLEIGGKAGFKVNPYVGAACGIYGVVKLVDWLSGG